jgi:hypothetical protein
VRPLRQAPDRRVAVPMKDALALASALVIGGCWGTALVIVVSK